MLNILKKLFRGSEKITNHGQKAGGKPSGCEPIETTSPDISPFDIEVKDVKIKQIILKN
jgi:hypothetical protein